jgi:hypothetical protein
LPPEEVQRLQAVRRYAILDTPPEPPSSASRASPRGYSHVPDAFISLIDEKRQWFKSCYGWTCAK